MADGPPPRAEGLERADVLRKDAQRQQLALADVLLVLQRGDERLGSDLVD